MSGLKHDAAPRRVAVVGAGPAGAACAAALQAAGLDVVVLDKSRGVGGRMATRRSRFVDAGAAHAAEQSVHFDHGAQHVVARDARFVAAMQAMVREGAALPWQPRIAGAAPEAGATPPQRFLPVPAMPALCQHWLHGVNVHGSRR